MKDSWLKYLSKSDVVHLLEIFNGCLGCVDSDSFKDLLNKLKKISKFDVAICTCAEQSRLPATLEKTLHPLKYCNFGDLVDMSRFAQYYKFDVPLQVILQALNLRYSSDPMGLFSDGRLNIIIPHSNGYQFSDGWIYGTHEKYCNRWILFAFASQNNHNTLKSETIEFAVPHLFHAFKRLRYLCTAHPFHLTKREFEILNWVKMGKTTWEIANILSVTERCVNFHIDNFRKKFGAVNRTQAVAVAVANGLIKM